MSHGYKNIVITPFTANTNNDPKIVFSGGDSTTNTDITLRVYTTSNGTLSFEGSAGQLFSITNDLSNTIFSVNDVSGLPLQEINVVSQQITFGQYYGNVGIGTANALYKLDVAGSVNIANPTLVIAGQNVMTKIANVDNKLANTTVTLDGKLTVNTDLAVKGSLFLGETATNALAYRDTVNGYTFIQSLGDNKGIFFAYGGNWGDIAFFTGTSPRVTLSPYTPIGWVTPGTGTYSPNQDVSLYREGVGILAQRVSSGAASKANQVFRLYNTYTNASNYERGVLDWRTTANTFTIGTEAGGTGTVRNMQFVIGGVKKLDYGVTYADNWTFGGTRLYLNGGSGYIENTSNYTQINGVTATVLQQNGYNALVAYQAHVDIVGTLRIGMALGSDLELVRDDRGILAQRFGTANQAFRIYNTYTDPSNFERGVLDWNTTANTFIIGTQSAGTGTARSLNFITGGTTALSIDSSQISTFASSIAFNASGGNATGRIMPVYGGGGVGLLIAPVSGSNYYGLYTDSIRITPAIPLTWTNDTGLTSIDLRLYRDSANTLAQRNGTAPQSFRIYNTYTDPSNWERLAFFWSSSTAYIDIDGAGTGNYARSLYIGTSNGAINDNRTVYFGTGSLTFGGGGSVNVFRFHDNLIITNLSSNDFGLLKFGASSSSYPALKRTGAALSVRLADDSALTDLYANNINASGNVFATAVYVNGSPVGATDLTPANNWANTIYVYAIASANDSANAANAYALGLSQSGDLSPANNWANTLYTSALASANGSANSANAYAVTVGASSNNYANTTFLKISGNQTFTGGFSYTSFNAGTNVAAYGTWTPNPANGNHQYANSNGAFTLAAPASDCDIDILLYNGQGGAVSGAGSITFSGFTVGSATGDAYATTANNKYLLSIKRINSVATYIWKALQ